MGRLRLICTSSLSSLAVDFHLNFDMKKILFALLVALSLTATVKAAPVMLIGSLVTVNNATSNSPPTSALSYNPSLNQFTITHGTLTATNALLLNFQCTLDQTNYVTVGTWYPTTTNAATEIVNANQYSITNYVRAQAVTTNSVQVGGTYGF